MVHGGTESGVLSLLEGKPESCGKLNVRSAPEVLDVVPRDRVKQFEIHDFVVKAKGFFAAKHGWFVVCWGGCCGGLVRACEEARRSQSQWRPR